MTEIRSIKPEFVEFVPDDLDDGVIYISIPYRTALHRCACGCGSEVVTPLSPTDWRVTFDGESISLWPSIGNWSFDCSSHYWIEEGRIRWAPSWTRQQIENGRARDRAAKADCYGSPPPTTLAPKPGLPSFRARVRKFLRLGSSADPGP